MLSKLQVTFDKEREESNFYSLPHHLLVYQSFKDLRLRLN